jgi:hypothetical protein
LQESHADATGILLRHDPAAHHERAGVAAEVDRVRVVVAGDVLHVVNRLTSVHQVDGHLLANSGLNNKGTPLAAHLKEVVALLQRQTALDGDGCLAVTG